MIELAQTVSVTTGQLIWVGGILTFIYTGIQIGDRLWGRRQNGNEIKGVCGILKMHLKLQESRHTEVMRGIESLRGGKD